MLKHSATVCDTHTLDTKFTAKKRTLIESWKPGKTRTAARGAKKKHTDDHTFHKVLLQVPLLESFLCRFCVFFFLFFFFVEPRVLIRHHTSSPAPHCSSSNRCLAGKFVGFFVTHSCITVKHACGFR